MISRINRLRSKKGFTMIEIIVVIAIIGILAAIIISSMSYDNKPTLGKGVAKDLYYVAQDAFSTTKIANPLAISTGSKAIYYASVDGTGTLKDIGTVTVSGAGASVTLTAASLSAEINVERDYIEDNTLRAANDVKAMNLRVREAFKNYLTDVDNMAGTLYVVADDQYRVKVAYWSDAPISVGGNVSLVDDCILGNGYYCCAYPVKYSMPGQNMLMV